MKDEQPHSTNHRILLHAILLASSCALCGCQLMASLAIGSVYLSRDRANIRITEDESDTKGCAFVKHLEASTFWGGFAFQDKALEKSISDLTHDSVEAGANLLLIRSKHKSFGASNSQGDAYRCPFGESTPPPKPFEENIDAGRTSPP
jgi:hypothetical protein